MRFLQGDVYMSDVRFLAERKMSFWPFCSEVVVLNLSLFLMNLILDHLGGDLESNSAAPMCKNKSNHI